MSIPSQFSSPPAPNRAAEFSSVNYKDSENIEKTRKKYKFLDKILKGKNP